MSGYLARLVDRAAGPPSGALAPRLGPVFPLAPRLDGDELAAGGTPAGSGVGGAPERRIADDRRPAEQPSAGDESGTPAAGGLRSPRATGGSRRAAAGARDAPTTPPAPRDAAAGMRVTTVQARAAAAAAEATVAVGNDIRVGARTEPPPSRGREPAPEREDGEPPAREVSEAGSRAAVSLAVRPVAVELPARRAAASAPQPAPRIEVRIGRVEIRRPVAPEPFEWPVAPAVDERPSSGFEDLAAARRYVDRRWS